MADVNVTSVSALLGKTVVLSEVVMGQSFRRSGIVIGVLTGLPGSRCGDEFLVEQDDGDSCFYSLSEVTLHAVA